MHVKDSFFASVIWRPVNRVPRQIAGLCRHDYGEPNSIPDSMQDQKDGTEGLVKVLVSASLRVWRNEDRDSDRYSRNNLGEEEKKSMDGKIARSNPSERGDGKRDRNMFLPVGTGCGYYLGGIDNGGHGMPPHPSHVLWFHGQAGSLDRSYGALIDYFSCT